MATIGYRDQADADRQRGLCPDCGDSKGAYDLGNGTIGCRCDLEDSLIEDEGPSATDPSPGDAGCSFCPARSTEPCAPDCPTRTMTDSEWARLFEEDSEARNRVDFDR
jgi:hypothetical protein